MHSTQAQDALWTKEHVIRRWGEKPEETLGAEEKPPAGATRFTMLRSNISREASLCTELKSLLGHSTV
jgi:hypothetical protein